jgi:hypothetical protein
MVAGAFSGPTPREGRGGKDMEGMRKVFLVAAVGLIVGMTTVQNAAARPPWILFGDAEFVKMGQGDNPWAVQLRSDVNVWPGYGGIAFFPRGGSFPFQDLWALSTDYDVTNDDCGGGSPRFQVRIDTDGDGVGNGNIFVYIGPFPNFTGCSPGWQSTGNLVDATDARWDTTQFGGPFYGTHAQALALLGDKDVIRVTLVVDSSWMMPDGEQTILVDDVTVNDVVLEDHGAKHA